jgi:hypothetical protein
VQVVHAVIALSLIGAIGLFSPFSRLERVLLLASYFVLYEYTVISRNYGIGFLIALIYAQMRDPAHRVYLNACLLGLLANTNMFAFILSGAFAFEYAVELLSSAAGKSRAAFAAALPPAMLYGVCGGGGRHDASRTSMAHDRPAARAGFRSVRLLAIIREQ